MRLPFVPKTIFIVTALALGATTCAAPANFEVNLPADKVKTHHKHAIQAATPQASQPTAAQVLNNIVQADNVYDPYLELGGFHGNGGQTLGTADLVYPLWQTPHNLFFTDLRGLKRTGPTIEGNFGLAYRQMNAAESWLWGLHGFYDLRRTQYANDFQQFNLGAEFKTLYWDVDGNYYNPIGTRTKSVAALNQAGTRPSDLGDGFVNFYYLPGAESALAGFDAQVGYSLPFYTPITVYGGGYDFYGAGVKTIAGPRGRVAWTVSNPFHMQENFWKNFFNQVTVESMVQHDRVRGTDWYVGLRLRMAFGEYHNVTGLGQRMTDYIYRDLDVVAEPLDRNFATDATEWTKANGTPYVGRIVNSANDLTNGISRDADFLVVTNSVTGLNSVQLGNNETVTGGQFAENIANSNYNFNVGADGSLAAAAGQNLLVLGSNDRIQSVTLDTSAGLYAVTNTGGRSIGNTSINNVIFNGGGVATTISDGSTDSQLSLTNNAFSLSKAVGGDAYDFVNLNVVAGKLVANTIANNTFSKTAEAAGTISMIKLAATPADGSSAELDVNNFTNNTFTLSGDAGITVNAIAVNATAASGTALININNMNSNTVTFSADGEANLKAFALVNHATGNGNSTINLTTFDSNTINAQVIALDAQGLSIDNQVGNNATGEINVLHVNNNTFNIKNINTIDATEEGINVSNAFAVGADDAIAHISLGDFTGNTFNMGAANRVLLGAGLTATGMSVTNQNNGIIDVKATGLISLDGFNNNTFVFSGASIAKGVSFTNSGASAGLGLKTVAMTINVANFDTNIFNFEAYNVNNIGFIAANEGNEHTNIDINGLQNNEFHFTGGAQPNNGFSFISQNPAAPHASGTITVTTGSNSGVSQANGGAPVISNGNVVFVPGS